MIAFNDEIYYAVAIGNLDGDSYPDLLIGGTEGLQWYESYGDNTFSLVDSFAGATVRDIIFYGYADADDSNGDPGSNKGAKPQVAYIASGDITGDPNDLATGGKVQTLVATSNNQATLTTLVENDNRIYHTAYPCDFDEDGLVEMFASIQFADNLASGDTHLYEIDASGVPHYIKNIEYGKAGTRGIGAAYFDGDDTMDIFVGAGNVLQWYEYNGTDDNGLKWRKTLLYKRIEQIAFADYDNDGAMGVFISQSASGGGGNTDWFEANGTDNSWSFRTHILAYHHSNVLAPGDWDGDASMDILFGCRWDDYAQKPLLWHENNGDNSSNYVDIFNQYAYQGMDGVLLSYPKECGDLGTFYNRTDLNQDCIVDIDDLLIFSGEWLTDSRESVVVN